MGQRVSTSRGLFRRTEQVDSAKSSPRERYSTIKDIARNYILVGRPPDRKGHLSLLGGDSTKTSNSICSIDTALFAATPKLQTAGASVLTETIQSIEYQRKKLASLTEILAELLHQDRLTHTHAKQLPLSADQPSFAGNNSVVSPLNNIFFFRTSGETGRLQTVVYCLIG